MANLQAGMKEYSLDFRPPLTVHGDDPAVEDGHGGGGGCEGGGAAQHHQQPQQPPRPPHVNQSYILQPPADPCH